MKKSWNKNRKNNNSLQKEHNMNINKAMIKILAYSRRQVGTNIIMDSKNLKNINSYPYLGSKVTSDEKSATDINSRIALFKQVFQN